MEAYTQAWIRLKIIMINSYENNYNNQNNLGFHPVYKNLCNKHIWKQVKSIHYKPVDGQAQ